MRRITAWRRIGLNLNIGYNNLQIQDFDPIEDDDEDTCLIINLGEKAISDKIIYCKATRVTIGVKEIDRHFQIFPETIILS